MVLILPETQPDPYGPQGAASSGLLASIETALRSECGEEAEHVTIRVLGGYIILEGLVPNEECLTRIRSIAEDIAGPGTVHVRLFRQ